MSLFFSREKKSNQKKRAARARFHLPSIVPHTPALYAALRNAHSLLAYVLFATVLMHVGAALFHLWVRRDGVFQAMARGKD
ncbi:unnamed protein product [Stenotrophomonas maltophilia]|nr:unnamed protein product [Stenotrophomonas maltophilia]